MKRRQPVFATCRRCRVEFGYLRAGGRPRIFCRPCAKAEQKLSTQFANAIAAAARADYRATLAAVRKEMTQC